MQRTQPAGIGAMYVFVAAAMAIVTWHYYGLLMPAHPAGVVTIWLLCVVCVGITVVVRRSLDNYGVGLDRSQLDPLTVARMMLVGRASAWTGAIVGGLYAGVASYVIPHAEQLAAAESELPTVVLGAVGGAALAFAGIVVERSCETPPPGDSEAAQ